MEENQKLVNGMVGRKRKGDEGGFNYVCALDGFSCEGRKGAVAHLKEKYPEKVAQLGDMEAQLAKLVSNSAFLEDQVNGGVKHSNGVSKAKKVDVEEEEEQGKRKDYPVTLDVLKMIDARTVRIPDYGSLVGRIARLLAVVLSKEVETDGDKEAVVKVVKCHKCDINLEDLLAGVMAHLEDKHQNFLDMLYTIFPPAKKRMPQFIEKAASKFELKIETAKEVDRLVTAKEKKEREDKMAVLKAEKEAREKEFKEWKEKKEQRWRENQEKEAKYRKEKRERDEKEREARDLKRRLEWELSRSEVEEKKRKMTAPRVVPLADEGRLVKERKLVISELKKLKGEERLKVRGQRLLKRKGELQAKLRNIKDQKTAELLEKRTTAILEKISPKQLRKLCMYYFGTLAGEQLGGWKEMMESVKLEVDYSLLGDFLSLLGCHSKTHHNTKKGFKFGHMLVTSNQSELVFEKGVIGIFSSMRDKRSWKIPSDWEMDEPSEDLGKDWDRERDTCLLNGTFKCGKNLAKIVTVFPDMKELMVDGEGKTKEAVKQRYAYLLNVYQNRGVYNEEFGSCFYSGDQEIGEEIEVMEEQDDGGSEEEEVMDITKDEEEKEDAEVNLEDVKEAKEESNGNAENGAELGEEAEEDDDEVDDALLDTPDSEPGEEDM